MSDSESDSEEITVGEVAGGMVSSATAEAAPASMFFGCWTPKNCFLCRWADVGDV